MRKGHRPSWPPMVWASFLCLQSMGISGVQPQSGCRGPIYTLCSQRLTQHLALERQRSLYKEKLVLGVTLMSMCSEVEGPWGGHKDGVPL